MRLGTMESFLLNFNQFSRTSSVSLLLRYLYASENYDTIVIQESGWHTLYGLIFYLMSIMSFVKLSLQVFKNGV